MERRAKGESDHNEILEGRRHGLGRAVHHLEQKKRGDDVVGHVEKVSDAGPLDRQNTEAKVGHRAPKVQDPVLHDHPEKQPELERWSARARALEARVRDDGVRLAAA
eukprot:Amastigsp_a677609_14.p8 type:complete len:107 gc:universal Amastigsp_a677609_14:1897-2217(+)